MHSGLCDRITNTIKLTIPEIIFSIFSKNTLIYHRMSSSKKRMRLRTFTTVILPVSVIFNEILHLRELDKLKSATLSENKFPMPSLSNVCNGKSKISKKLSRKLPMSKAFQKIEKTKDMGVDCQSKADRHMDKATLQDKMGKNQILPRKMTKLAALQIILDLIR